MTTSHLTRRDALKALAALGAGGALLYAIHNNGTGNEPLRQSAVKADGASPRDRFTALSALVTMHDDLPAVAVDKMYEVFKGESWATEHVDRCLNKINAYVSGGAGVRPSMRDEGWAFDEGEAWFVEHLLYTWYTGIYYHQERPTRRVLFEHALMFRALLGRLPVPYLEHVGYGAWARPPKAGQ